MTVVEIPSATHVAQRWLGGRFRLDERISLDDQVSGFSGPCGFSWEARGLSLWKATDQLLGRPVTIYLLPPGIPVPRAVVEAVQSAAKVTDPRLATIYDTDFRPECPYIVSEWTPGTHIEDLVLSGLPRPALAAAMIADAADALAVAHQAGRPHLCLTPRSLRWDASRGLKITGLGLDAALCGATAESPPAVDSRAVDSRAVDSRAVDSRAVDSRAVDSRAVNSRAVDSRAADTAALARMLYALLTGYWPGDEATALPPAPRHKGRVCTPRQVRAGVPAILDAITYRALWGQAADAPLRAQTPAGLAMALRMVQRPSYQLESPEDETMADPPIRADPGAARRHAWARASFGRRTTLLRPAE